MVQEKLIIKNMMCHCCIKNVRHLLEEQGVKVHKVLLGEAWVIIDESRVSRRKLATVLEQEGFGIVVNRERQIFEQVKCAVVAMVHHTTFSAMVKNSDFLVQKFNLSYQYISTIFSKYANTTLEKFIILQKIEKVKELIQYDELTLSEIAQMMGYSSVQYLSTQFKSVTGVTVSDFKKDPAPYRLPVDRLIKSD